MLPVLPSLGLLLSGSLLSAAQVTTTLQVDVTDDGLPDPAKSLNYSWTVLEAPVGAQVDFQPSADVAGPTVGFDQPGRYLLGVAVDDGHLGSGRTIEILVQGAETAATAPAPAASAGAGGGCGGGNALALLLGLVSCAFIRPRRLPARL